MRRVLCLHLPYLATERAWRDGLCRSKPGPLVLTRPVGAAHVVERVCAQARRLGVRPGMSLAQARALAPELLAVACDDQKDRAALTELARWATRFGPTVEVVEPDTLLVDVTGCALLFRGEANIARQAVAGLKQRGFGARAAIADTVGAAYAVATAGPEPIAVVPVGQSSAWLAPLPPAALRLDPGTCEQLDRLGIRSIGDLLMLPRASLATRFGPELILRIRQALGETFEILTACTSPPPPLARLAFEMPATDWSAILPAVPRLWTDVCEQLRRRGMGVRRLECVVYYEGAPPDVLCVELVRPSRQWAHVGTLLEQRLEQCDDGLRAHRAASEAHELCPLRITGLMLVARETSCWRVQPGELFAQREPGVEEALDMLIDRLAGRLGHEAIVRPELVDDHQPELAFRYVPVVAAGCAPKEMGMDWRSTVPIRRPLRLLARPVRVRVRVLAGDGPPTWLTWRGQEHVVVRAVGPERLETAWWRGADVRRDYFRITVASGEEFWVFRALNAPGWYLHGIFG